MNSATSALTSPLFGTALLGTRKEQLLRSYPFDLWLIAGAFFVALTFGLLSVFQPAWFPFLLLTDLWLLGYHHVVATYTRIAFDSESLRKYRFYVFFLPFLVAIPSVGISYWIGPWTITTLYLYWQWFHYTRQSYGISRIYARKAAPLSNYDERLNTVALYSLPFLGILYRSFQAPDTFLGTELKVLPVSLPVVQFFAAITFFILVLWLVSQAQQKKRGSFSRARFLYLMSHHLIFTTGYLLIPDINYGWLVINAWHNVQYIFIVWLYNNNRFKNGIQSEARLLSIVSQSKNWPRYVFLCLGTSTVLYFALTSVTTGLASAVPAAMLVYSVINFHHYVVDAVIWKVRKKEVREHLVGQAT